jgi:rhodanese-related sulfurtransferase
MKTAQDYLAEANAVVPKIAVEGAIARHTIGEAVFIDVRDGSEIAKTGTIAGALHIPRGFVEFAADDATPFHNDALTKDGEIILVCGAGGMAALTGKTLIDMGYTNVSNAGGFQAWKDAGGATE